MYLNPKNYSMIFQCYEQYFKDKEGVNDIIGDLDWTPSHPILAQLCLNFARNSTLTSVIIEILTIYLKSKVSLKQPEFHEKSVIENLQGSETEIKLAGLFTRL